MSSVDFEQISTWITGTFWPFAEEHAAVLGVILAALIILTSILKRILIKSMPGLADGQVRVEPCDLPPCRFFTGNIVGFNKGRKHCNLLGLQLLHDRCRFEISDITDRRDKELTAPDRGVIGIQLPIKFRAKEEKKIYFFGYHHIAKAEELPDTLSLKVTFNGRKKTLLYSLVRVLDETYCVRPPDKYPPRRLR